jgi:hypothetical protein
LESRPGYLQVRGFSCISSVSPGKYQNITSTIHFSFLPNHLQYIASSSYKHSTLSLPANNLQKSYIDECKSTIKTYTLFRHQNKRFLWSNETSIPTSSKYIEICSHFKCLTQLKAIKMKNMTAQGFHWWLYMNY